MMEEDDWKQHGLVDEHLADVMPSSGSTASRAIDDNTISPVWKRSPELALSSRSA